MPDISRTKYDGVAMILHWVTPSCMIFMIIFGEELMEDEEGEEAAEAAMNAAFLPSLHVSIGVAILLLTVLRLASGVPSTRRRPTPPP